MFHKWKKTHDFLFCLEEPITRFFYKLSQICAVARLLDGDIEKLWEGLSTDILLQRIPNKIKTVDGLGLEVLEKSLK